MKKILLIILIVSLTGYAIGQKAKKANDKPNELQKFQETKSKTIDSLSIVFSTELRIAQEQYEKSILEADKKYQTAMEDLEKQEIELLEKFKEKYL